MQFNSETQLKLLYQTGVRFSENNYQRFKMQDVITLMKKLPSPHKSMAQEFLILMKLVLSLSVTNAFSKRRFSALKKIKHEAEGCGSFFCKTFCIFTVLVKSLSREISYGKFCLERTLSYYQSPSKHLLAKLINRNARKRYKIFVMLPIKTQERRKIVPSQTDVVLVFLKIFILTLEIFLFLSFFFLELLLLILNRQMFAGYGCEVIFIRNKSSS